MTNTEIAQIINERIGTAPVPFESIYSLALEIYLELGGTEESFDDIYSILLQTLPLAEQGGGGSTPLMISVTYDELKNRRNNSLLIRGQRYRITDYVTTAQDENGTLSSAKHPFDLIVTAVDVNKLSETGVKVAHCADDDYFVAKPLRYYIDEADSYGYYYNYNGTIDIDGTTYYKWYCEDSIGSHAIYILTTEATYSNEPDGEDENGEYYYTSYQFAGFINDSDEEVEEYEVWQDKHKCIIKTEEFDGTMYLIIGDIYLQESGTLQNAYTPKLSSWEVKYCLDNDKERFSWAQVEKEGLGFSAIKLNGSKTITNYTLVLGDEMNGAESEYEGQYYIDSGAYMPESDGTIEYDGTTYYKWYEPIKGIHVLTTEQSYTNQVSGTDDDGYDYYTNVYNVVGEMTIDDESFSELYKDYKRIIKTESEEVGETGTFLYKRYEAGDTQDSYAWVYVRNTNNKSVDDITINWNNVDTSDIIYTSSEEPIIGTETGDYEVAEYSVDVQFVPDGKGVIYYLKDEFNNEAEYDFKNVIFIEGLNVIQTYWDGETCLYVRYESKDSDGLYAYAYLNNSNGYSISEYYNEFENFWDYDSNDIIYFENKFPRNNEYDNNGECYVTDSYFYIQESRFTFGVESSELNPIDDSFNGNSNNNSIESEITNNVRNIPIIRLGEEIVNYTNRKIVFSDMVKHMWVGSQSEYDNLVGGRTGDTLYFIYEE